MAAGMEQQRHCEALSLFAYLCRVRCVGSLEPLSSETQPRTLHDQARHGCDDEDRLDWVSVQLAAFSEFSKAEDHTAPPAVQCQDAW